MISVAVFIGVVLAGLPAPSSSAADRTTLPWQAASLDRALLAELQRSTAMRVEGYPPPYFIALRASEGWSHDWRCGLGGVAYHHRQRWMRLTPEVRVGSYEMDSHPSAPAASVSYQPLPFDGDGFAVRHAVWTELDGRYKAAAGEFLRKQALRVRRGKADYDTDDLSREEPLVRDFAPDFPQPGRRTQEALEGLCRELSAIFRDEPALLDSQVQVMSESARHRLFNSEGTRIRHSHSLARVVLEAEAMAPDGMRQSTARTFFAPGADRLPSLDVLRAAVRETIEDLRALTAAVSTSPLSAPALVDPSVGAALLQALATRLSGEQQRNPEGAQTFRNKLGQGILPGFVTLEDDPTLSSFGGRPLVGHYAVDDEGVLARRVTLVERGVLGAYLLSRYPAAGFGGSNGHGRMAVGRRAMGRSSNLVLRPVEGLPRGRLLQLLRQESERQGKPYGLWIQKARGWRQQNRTGQHQALRLSPTLVYLVDSRTGESRLVRDLDLVGTPLDLLGKIVAAGDDPEAVSGIVEEASGALPASTVTPTLLLREVELQRAETKPERLPVLTPP